MPTKKFASQPHLGAAIARPFVIGARVQLKRYVRAQAWCKHDPVDGVNECIHEVSSLFENLATVVTYLNLCGVSHTDGQLYLDIRNHIRHDVREKFDLDEKRKTERAQRLGLHPNLQLDLTFRDGAIKVGSTEVKTNRISSFINFAEMSVYALMTGGKVEASASQ